MRIRRQEFADTRTETRSVCSGGTFGRETLFYRTCTINTTQFKTCCCSPSANSRLILQYRVQVLVVQLPGRGERQCDEMYESIQAATIRLYEVVRHRLTRAGVQFAIIAHSMGRRVAYELALHLQEIGYIPVGRRG
jgi:pimeloyl-ACP methyl ester carboxylesterase